MTVASNTTLLTRQDIFKYYLLYRCYDILTLSLTQFRYAHCDKAKLNALLKVAFV